MHTVRHKIIALSFSAAAITLPCVASAQIPDRLVPQCSPHCGYNDFMQMISNILTFLFFIAIMVAVLMIAYTGFTFVVSAGKPAARNKAKTRLWKIVLGLFWMAAAFFAVRLILDMVQVDQKIGDEVEDLLELE